MPAKPIGKGDTLTVWELRQYNSPGPREASAGTLQETLESDHLGLKSRCPLIAE